MVVHQNVHQKFKKNTSLKSLRRFKFQFLLEHSELKSFLLIISTAACQDIGVPQNGRSSVSISGLSCGYYEVNTVIGYSCNANYRLQGSGYLTCRGNRFDGSLPQCVPGEFQKVKHNVCCISEI